MTLEVSVTGDADKLALLGRATKELGDGALRKKLNAGIQRAARPLKASAAVSATARLPRRGGLNLRVASARITVRTRTSPKTAGVRIVATKDLDLRAINRGRVRHPVFGNRKAWVNQQVPSGWFTDAMAAGTPAVRVEIGRVLDAVAAELIGKTHG